MLLLGLGIMRISGRWLIVDIIVEEKGFYVFLGFYSSMWLYSLKFEYIVIRYKSKLSWFILF